MHYRILERIGAGGMAVVYKAQDTKLNRTVAIKVLPHEAVSNPERRRRFIQEAQTASALDHPNIVTIYDIAEAEGQHFIVMQYVDGKTLRELVGDKGLELSESLSFAMQMADGLGAAHEKGIVHRDFKPDNVIVTEKGQIKICDFGVAKLMEPVETPVELDDEAPTLDRDQPLTREGHILGTASYMSPEQAQGKKVDGRSDIFSLGSVLYEMMTGRRAFSGDNMASVMAAIIRDEPERVSALLPSVPADLEDVISRALRKEREQRFQSMTDMRLALEEIKEELDSGSTKSVPSRPGRNPWILAAALGGILLVSAALWWAGISPLSTETASVTAEIGAPSIAVLPFDDLSPDRENEYFGDGMAEELINALAKIPGLRVAARGSSWESPPSSREA